MKLNKLATLRIGLPLKRWQTGGGQEYRLLSAKYINVYGDITNFESFQGLNIPDEFLTRPGDVIMKIAAPNQTFCITQQNQGLLVSSYFAIIRCSKPERCLPEFLAVYFSSPAFTQMAERERTCTTVKSLKLSALQEQDIPLPPLDQQRDIVEFAALAITEQKQLQQMLLLKQEYHQSLLSKRLEEYNEQ